jgi:hypothetical protein
VFTLAPGADALAERLVEPFEGVGRDVSLRLDVAQTMRDRPRDRFFQRQFGLYVYSDPINERHLPRLPTCRSASTVE